MIFEIFQIHPEDKDKIKPGMVLAVDESNPDYFVLADKNNSCIVGVVSENPAYCAGGKNIDYGVLVALAGRVKVKFNKTICTPHIGCYAEVILDGSGYCTCTLKGYYNNLSKIVGKIIKIIDDKTVEILINTVN